MAQPSPGSEFLRALAAAALRDGDPAALAERAAAGLAGVFQSQKSMVLDVSSPASSSRGSRWAAWIPRCCAPPGS
jgi:hypothetical protein